MAGELGNNRTSGDHPIYYIIENGQNIEKSPGDLRRSDRVIINKKKGTCRTMDLAILVDDRVKLKETEKTDKYADLSRELKKTPKNCGT